MEKEKIEGEDNVNENNSNNKEKKKRGKTSIKSNSKNINPIKNMTLDSMFGTKNNQ